MSNKTPDSYTIKEYTDGNFEAFAHYSEGRWWNRKRWSNSLGTCANLKGCEILIHEDVRKRRPPEVHRSYHRNRFGDVDCHW